MAARLGTQQAAVYAAEAESIDGLGRRWRRVADAQRYVDGLIGGDWFFDRWPHLVRCVVTRRGSGSVWSTCEPLDAGGPGGAPTEGVILLADGGLRQPVLLHELAHLLLPPAEGHGGDFVRVLLELVRVEMGFFAFAALDQALRARAAAVGG